MKKTTTTYICDWCQLELDSTGRTLPPDWLKLPLRVAGRATPIDKHLCPDCKTSLKGNLLGLSAIEDTVAALTQELEKRYLDDPKGQDTKTDRIIRQGKETLGDLRGDQQ